MAVNQETRRYGADIADVILPKRHHDMYKRIGLEPVVITQFIQQSLFQTRYQCSNLLSKGRREITGENRGKRR
jgi:hypothetical protein